MNLYAGLLDSTGRSRLLLPAIISTRRLPVDVTYDSANVFIVLIRRYGRKSYEYYRTPAIVTASYIMT